MHRNWLEVLSACSLFEGIAKEDINGILQCLGAEVTEYKKNEYLTIAGEKFSRIGVVLDGTVALTKETVKGNRVIINLLGPGEIFGEMAAYSDLKIWPVTVTAKTDCTIMFFSQEKIVGCCGQVCQCHQQLMLNMLRILSNRALMLNRKVEYLSLKSLRGKIATYILEEYEKSGHKIFQLNLNRNDLADFINATRPSLSRELGKMRDEGLLDFYGTAIKIKDLEKLRSFSE
ncbi:MAG: Crp/Fnr family transcriptional regulator [Desulfitobacteriia bacterium]|jgi:CRP-like cAMP-binding protein